VKLRTYTSLFIAIFVYTITVITGLIKGLPLFGIFINGIIITIITAVSVWIIVFLLEFLADKDIDKDSNKNSDKRNNNMDTNSVSSYGKNSISKESNHDSKTLVSEKTKENVEDFSPMTPPVLEVAQQELDRGEGN